MPTPKDDRDFNTGIFGWFDYKPKHTRHEIETLSVKDQNPLNTCQWCATTVQKEVDEKCRLSVRSFVIKGKQLGYVSRDGFSNLRDGQKVLQKWGILKEGIISERITSWDHYSDPKVLDGKDKEAAKHKISSYWNVGSRNDALKLLDDGRVISTGLKWYTGFNVSGGFSFPWIISKIIGLLVGGHAIIIKGYDLKYKLKKVYICQNSFGAWWGLNGNFYIEMDHMDKANYGYFTNIDEIDKDVGGFLTSYDGKNVKGKGSSIYYIQRGKKKPYPHWPAFISFNGKRKGFTVVEQELLDKVEVGDIMDIKKSYYWDFLKDIKEDKQLDKLLEIINEE